MEIQTDAGAGCQGLCTFTTYPSPIRFDLLLPERAKLPFGGGKQGKAYLLHFQAESAVEGILWGWRSSGLPCLLSHKALTSLWLPLFAQDPVTCPLLCHTVIFTCCLRDSQSPPQRVPQTQLLPIFLLSIQVLKAISFPLNANYILIFLIGLCFYCHAILKTF